MIPQLKSFCIVLSLLIVPVCSKAQAIQNMTDQNRIDSLQELLSSLVNRQMNDIRVRFLGELNEHRLLIDSLFLVVLRRETEIEKLDSINQVLTKQLARTDQSVIANRSIISAEKERFRRIFMIAGLSVLALLLVSTILFFLMLLRHTEQTERKITALRKYTYQEIKETRTGLMKKLKKQVNKLRTKLPKEKKKVKKRGN